MKTSLDYMNDLDAVTRAIVSRRATQSEGHAVALGTYTAWLSMLLSNPTEKQRDFVLKQMGMVCRGI